MSSPLEDGHSRHDQRNCWTRLKTHGPFEEYDPPHPGTSYVIPHYRCSTCGHKLSLVMGAFLRPVEPPR